MCFSQGNQEQLGPFQNNDYNNKISLVLRSSMQIQEQRFNCIQILRHIVLHRNVLILTIFINFLDPEQLEAVAQLALEHHRQQPFYRIVIAKLFMGKYLNRLDRSIFFLFYDEPDFQSIQKNTINSLAIRQYPFLEKSYYQYQDILMGLRAQMVYLQTQQQFHDIIELLFFEPDLPLPKMKRETIGMYCESAFQEHLSLIRFPNDELQELWMEEPILELKNILNQQLTIIIANGTYNYSEANVRRKIQRLRYRVFQITHENWKQQLIQGFKMHNLLVLLLGLCSQLVFTYQTLLSNMDDPFMRFIEFQLRSSVFRNIVLSIQDKLSFLMSNYNTFYQAAFNPPPTHPPLNFYRPALSIWARTMKQFHPRNTNIYNYIISKLREQNLRQFLIEKTEKLPSFYTPLKQQTLMQTFSIAKKELAYQQNGNKLQIESFFQNNLEMYEILAKDYLQYTVDLSLNEYTVHWCGFSEHQIKNSPFFHPFSENIIQQSASFYESIRKVLYQSIPEQLKLSIFREVVKEDLQFLSERLVKPVTIKGIVEVVNQWIKQQVQHMQGYAVFAEEGFSKYRIVIDFEEKDNMLTYFGTKAKLEMNCPINLTFYYNIRIDDSIDIEKDSDEESEQGGLMLEKYESEGEGNGETDKKK